jgi:hypothetical protein
MDNFVAFISTEVLVWHQPVHPLNDEAVFLGKQGAVYACVDVDTVD